MNELSLFSGYGGFNLGFQLAGLKVRTVGYVEWEKYPQEIIKARIRDGYLDDAPILGDIRSFDFTVYRGLVDLITAGFPCQPFSKAGRRRSHLDNRNMWPETRRTIDEVRPRFILLENVSNITYNGYAGTVVGDLASIGYDCEWQLISASEIGAPHVRERWLCLAYSNTDRQRRSHRELEEQSAIGRFNALNQSATLGDEIPGEGINRRGGMAPRRNAWYENEPDVARMVDGNTDWVDERIHITGNGLVPAVVREFLRRVIER